MKMKKRVIGVLAAALVLTLATTSALAAEWGRGAGARNTVSTTTTAIAAADSGVQTSPYYGRGGCHYLDVDGDGAYDYCVGAINPYLDADGDGVYDTRLTAADPYVDTDGDGVYDYYVGRAYAYVDSDGDGVCDYYAGQACHYLDADGDGICDSCGLYVGRGAVRTGAAVYGDAGDGLWGCYGYGDCYSYGGGCHGNGGGRYGCGYYSGSAAAGSTGATSVGYGYRGGCRR